MKLRSLRHTNTKNLQNDANFFDASCSDDIIFSIASYLPSRDLVNLALTSKRFGGKRVAAEDVPQRSSGAHDMNIILWTGDEAFAIPNIEWGINKNFRKCRVVGYCKKSSAVIGKGGGEYMTYKVEFEDAIFNGDNRQWVYQTEIMSMRDMTRNVERNLKYFVEKREGNDIFISHFVVDKPMNIASETFIQEVGARKVEQLNTNFNNHDGDRNWSLVEEASLRTSLKYLSNEDKGCLIWREQESWMHILRQFEGETKALCEEEEKFKADVETQEYEEDIDLVSLDSVR